MPNSTFVVLVLVATTIFATARTAQADEWHKTYTVSGKPTVHVETNDGSVRISTWNEKQIEARIEAIGWRIDNNDVHITERQTGDRLDLDVRVPNGLWNFVVGRRSLRIELRIPREADLNVRTGDGSVETANNTGTVDIHSGDGHIRVTDAKGDVRLSTSDGHINAVGLDGQVDASSGDGHIQVEGRFDALNVRTSDGTINARALKGSRISTSWTMRSGDGTITLRLPEDFKADLDARTGDGRINVDFPIAADGKLRRSEVRGRINGGGPALTARTGDGSINILR